MDSACETKFDIDKNTSILLTADTASCCSWCDVMMKLETRNHIVWAIARRINDTVKSRGWQELGRSLPGRLKKLKLKISGIFELLHHVEPVPLKWRPAMPSFHSFILPRIYNFSSLHSPGHQSQPDLFKYLHIFPSISQQLVLKSVGII